VERVSLESLAERADYVSVHTLLNAETRHLIGEAFFRRMKPTAILINTSRGPVVDEKALARALQDKRLAGAALDVWEEEPIAADNPLLKMDNVIATPHAAYYSSAAVAQIPGRCGEEVARVLTGQRPLNVVNPEVYAPGGVRRARGVEWGRLEEDFLGYDQIPQEGVSGVLVRVSCDLRGRRHAGRGSENRAHVSARPGRDGGLWFLPDEKAGLGSRGRGVRLRRLPAREKPGRRGKDHADGHHERELVDVQKPTSTH